MANRQVKINLLFDANTTAAQSNIQQLSTMLQQISTKTIVGVDSGSLQQAVGAAQQLQIALQEAVNVDTGKLDLIKLQSSLKSSGTSVQTLATQLRAVGPTGEQAFLRVANAVSQAQVPMVKTNGLIANFMTTLANTAKWQIASSAIHGIMGAFQSATSHAKSLNKALTDIQMVTHFSNQEMAVLARQATEAANALNTTSTEYAKAALIFYQQGLDGSAVEERANTVIKLAHATGESAQVVSDQMTAIWNNFDDGTASLESYADALARLGAITAASTDEIAAGLEKFAAIAGTVGLEYNTAAAAVATVVAETRQSAEVVGTAFKTIFARVQGLSLGETLDDGVDLNKYSAALQKIGVDVLTADGKLRDMDAILSDMGEKWRLLGKETQVAVAQAVGGTRQYNQLIALMDNWDKVVDNIREAENATGELNIQQKIYEQSYQGSLDRLEQAKKELYESFISDDLLIGWNDGMTALIKSFGDFADRIGGIGPLVFSLVGIFSKTLFPLVTMGMTKISNMISVYSGKAAADVAATQGAMREELNSMINNPAYTQGMQQQMQFTSQLLQAKQQLMIASKTMTEAQKAEAQSRLEITEAIMNETMQILQQKDALEKQANAAKEALNSTQQRREVAQNVVEQRYLNQSEMNAPEDESEWDREKREQRSQLVINKSREMSATDLNNQIAMAEQITANSKAIKANGGAEGADPNLLAAQEELLTKMGLGYENLTADLSKYVDLLKEARDIQKEKADILEHEESDKVGVGVVSREHDTYEFGSDIAESSDKQLAELVKNSNNTMQTSTEDDITTVSMEASLSNYEQLYEALGKQKTLQSELATVVQEVTHAQGANAAAAKDCAVAQDELTNAEKELEAASKKVDVNSKVFTKNISSQSKAFSKLTKEEQAVVRAQEKVAAATGKLNKAYQKQSDTLAKMPKDLAKSRDGYMKLAEDAKATESQTKQLKAAFDGLENGTGDTKAHMQTIATVFKDLGIAADTVAQDLIDMGASMEQMLIKAGYSDDQIKILSDAFRELANQAPQVANGVRNTDGALGGLINKVPTATASFSTMMQSAMTLTGNLMSLKSGLQSLFMAFDEGATPTEKFQNVLSGVMGILPMFIAFTNAAKAAQDKRNASTIAGVAADTAKTVSENVKTASTWANTVANIANLLSSPWTMAIAAVAIVAISAYCASMEKKTAATERNTAAQLKNAKASSEEAQANKEKVDSFNEAYEAYKKTGEVTDDLKKSSEELIKVYDIENGAILMMTNNYNALASAINRARKEELEKTKADQKSAMRAKTKEMSDAMREGIGHKTDSGGYAGTFSGNSKAAKRAMSDENYEYLNLSGNEVQFAVSDISDPTQMYAYYKELMDLQRKMEAEAAKDPSINLGKDALYNDILTELAEGKEAYEEIASMMDSVQNSDMEIAMVDALGDKNVDDIQTLEEYQALYDEYMNKYKQGLAAQGIEKDSLLYNELIDKAEAYIDTYENLSDLKLKNSAFDDLKTGQNDAAIKELQDYYMSLSPEDQDLFWEIPLNTATTKEAAADLLEDLKIMYSEHDIVAKVRIDKEIADAHEDGTLTKEKFLKGNYDMSWEEFVRLDAGDAADYLQTQKENIDWDAFDDTLESKIKTQETQLEGYTDQKAAADQVRTDANMNLNNAQQQYENWKYHGAYDVANKTTQDFIGYNGATTAEGQFYSLNNFMANAESSGWTKTDESMGTAGDIVSAYMDLYRAIPAGATNMAAPGMEKTKEQYDALIALMKESGQFKQWNEENWGTLLEGALFNKSDQDVEFGAAFQKLLQTQSTSLADGGKTYTDITTDLSTAQSSHQTAVDAQTTVTNQVNSSTQALDNLYQDRQRMQQEESQFISDLSDEYGIAEESIAAYVEMLGQSNEALRNDKKMTLEVTKAHLRMKKGMDTLSSNWKEWDAVMSDSNSTLLDIAEVTGKVKPALQDILNLGEGDWDKLAPDFVQEHWQLIRNTMNGVEGAYTDLKAEAAEDILLSVKPEIVDTDGDGELDQVFQDLNDKLASYNEAGFEVGFALNPADQADFFAACNEMINAAGMTAAEAEKYFAKMGYDVKVKEVTVEPETTEWHIDNPVLDEEATALAGVPVFKGQPQILSGTNSVGGGKALAVETITPNGNYGGKVDVSNFSRGKSGGGGGSKKKVDTKKKADVVDRYKEVTDSLKDVSNAMSKASAAADGLYGMARIKNMEKVNSLLQKEVNLLGQKRKEAKGYLDADRSEMESKLAEASEKVLGKTGKDALKFAYDKNGNITNYTTIMTDLYDKLNSAINTANQDNEVSDDEQTKIDTIQEAIDNLKDSMADYEETKDTLFELDQQEIEKFNQILSNNFEKINAKIELDVEFNERDLAYLEYQLSKVESDVYAQREAASYSKDQLASYSANLSTYADAYNSLNQAYANGEISQASYVESMKSVADGLTENLSNVRELDQAMQEYYGNTLSMAQEEISKYTDLMEHSTTVLDHYQNLMGLFGQSTDYKMMGKILNAKATVSKDAYDVSAKNYDMLKKQAEDAKTLYDDAVKAGKTGVELDILEQQWLDAQTAANEAQDQMLSDAAEWAENMRAVLENSLAGFAQQLEDALTGDFGSFDALSTEMERASSLQEEYLTTTNKIYETNKMMRTAQKEIDKTTNQMAKRKLKEFINETAAMQEQGKLSQYELDIQQAKYDLLLAEIALKEAQNAKSTVRLQRDSEGNFGYVYTADQSAIDDAQQKFEDSQNALYNKGLEGANDYAQKYTETMSEMNDALAEANQKYLDGEYKDVNEYNDAIDNIRKYYYQKLEDYSSLYQVAIGTDSRVTQDAWSSAFGAMTTQTEQWKTKTEEYIGQSKDAFEKFNLALQPMKESLSGSALSIQQITQESNRLKTALTKKDGVIDSLGAVLNSVKGVTAEYITQRKELEALIATYEAYATAANNHAKDAAFDENAIAAGLEIAVKKTAAWATGVGKDEDFSDKTKAIDTSKGYTILRWDQGKNHFLISDSAGNYGWVKKSDLVGFDSGGYTGEWGPYGKMAMLHEKEMVLNQNDTENFLASMEFLHKILEVIDLQAMSSQLGGILSSPNLTNSNSSTIEQNVHIEASFPNATNHSEIEEAFNNLINTASQYANRK